MNSVQRVLGQLTTGGPAQRLQAITRLEELGPATNLPILALVKYADGEHPRVRAGILRLLRQALPSAARSTRYRSRTGLRRLMLKLRGEEQLNARAAYFQACSPFLVADPSKLSVTDEPILSRLDEREQAIHESRILGHDQFSFHFGLLLTHRRASIRRAVALRLGGYTGYVTVGHDSHDEKMVEHLMWAGVFDPHPEVRLTAICSLERFDGYIDWSRVKDLPDFFTMLADEPDERVRAKLPDLQAIADEVRPSEYSDPALLAAIDSPLYHDGKC